VGVFTTHESSFNNEYGQAFNFDYTPVSGALAFPPGWFHAQLPEVYDEYAAFGDLTWKITDAFSLSGGGRYAHNDQDWTANVAPNALGTTPGITHVGTHEGVSTWMGTAEYRFNKDTMAYVRAATGYRPGGPNSPIAGIPQTVGADSLVNYELGIKSTFLEHRAQIDAAVYHIDWKDIQLVAFTPSDLGFLANGGKAVSQGVEFAGTLSPVSHLTLGLNAAYTDAHLTSVIPAASYLMTGYQLPNVPKESFSVTADYDWQLWDQWTARVGAGYRHLGEQWLGAVERASPTSTPTLQAPAYSVTDLNAGFRNEHLTFSAYVRNLSNTRAIISGAGQGDTIVTNGATGVSAVFTSFQQPRTIGLGVDYKF
jgi:outer membrane receptor protein involved in Fe transport